MTHEDFQELCAARRPTTIENECEINKKLNHASLTVGDLQMKDFRGLRNEKLDTREVENFLDGMAEEIA